MNADPTPKLCECGCGGEAPLAYRTEKARGWVKGHPVRYIRGHAAVGKLGKQRSKITEDDYTVEDRGYETPCWILALRSRVGAGYGRIRIRGKKMLAHRAMWIQEVGEIPSDKELDHLCLIKDCIRPSHMEVVTHAVNMQRTYH